MMTKTSLSMLISLAVAMSACTADGNESDSGASDGADGDSGSSSGTPDFTPTEGDWTFGSGTWISDECQASFLSTPIGWVLSDATTESFELSFQFQEAGSLTAAPLCTLNLCRLRL